MHDSGNPNVRTNYVGKFTITAPDNLDHYCMLSNVNDVIFCGDYTSDGNGLVCTLPNELKPESNLYFPIVANGNVVIIEIATNGEITSSELNTMHNLKGFSFNISCNYYSGS